MPRIVLISLAIVIASSACGAAEPDPPAPAAGSVGSPAEGSQDSPSKRAARPAAKPEPVEDPAPDFSFETFEGDTFSLVDQRGTPVVLNFWESW